MDKDLKLKILLEFWQIFETGLHYNEILNSTSKDSVAAILENNGFECSTPGQVSYQHINYESYFSYSEHQLDYTEEIRWLASTAKQYAPISIKLPKDKFTMQDRSGTIFFEVHLHYGGGILIDCKLLFNNIHTVTEYCRSSNPRETILEEANCSLWDFMLKTKETIVAILKNNGVNSKVRSIDIQLEKQVHPWHHTWIILGYEGMSWDDFKKDQWQQDFLEGGRYFKHALGLTQRMDDWYMLSTKFFAEKQQIHNLSPYENSAIYITNAGNVIVPNFELLNKDSFKNNFVDILFATEMGNVQRFLFLVHVTYISKRAVHLQKQIESIRHGDISEQDLADIVLKLEEDLNRDILEITDDIMPTRVRRLMFTSILKLTLFKEMIKQLHGYEYEESMNSLLAQMQRTLAREREVIEIRASQRENELLKNLQLVFIITLATELIALFFYTPETYIEFGLELLAIAIVVSIVIYFGIVFISRLKEKFS
ncbi:MAG: hypothetical protein ACTSR2_06405 [Candidatus Hodarchaeales archaeon]